MNETNANFLINTQAFDSSILSTWSTLSNAISNEYCYCDTRTNITDLNMAQAANNFATTYSNLNNTNVGNINMKNFLNIKHEERMIPVTDDWHPCFEGNKVRLKLSLNYYNGKYYTILSVWGKDDTGVEMYRESLSEEIIEEEYKRLFIIFNSIPYNADRQWFLDRGFVPA